MIRLHSKVNEPGEERGMRERERERKREREGGERNKKKYFG